MFYGYLDIWLTSDTLALLCIIKHINIYTYIRAILVFKCPREYFADILNDSRELSYFIGFYCVLKTGMGRNRTGMSTSKQEQTGILPFYMFAALSIFYFFMFSLSLRGELVETVILDLNSKTSV